MSRITLPVLLLLAAAAASAQPVTPPRPGFETRPPGGPVVIVPPGGVTPPPTLETPPLTVETAPKVEQRLRAWLDAQRSAAPTPAQLRAARLSSENDLLERSSATPANEIGPVHVGRLLPATAAKGLGDPGLADVTRSTLRARLGRAPSQAELDAELRAFDTRIAQLNQALAAQRTQIAKAVKAGEAIPRAIEAAALGVAPADPEVQSAATREGLRGLFQTLLGN